MIGLAEPVLIQTLAVGLLLSTSLLPTFPPSPHFTPGLLGENLAWVGRANTPVSSRLPKLLMESSIRFATAPGSPVTTSILPCPGFFILTFPSALFSLMQLPPPESLGTFFYYLGFPVPAVISSVLEFSTSSVQSSKPQVSPPIAASGSTPRATSSPLSPDLVGLSMCPWASRSLNCH